MKNFDPDATRLRRKSDHFDPDATRLQRERKPIDEAALRQQLEGVDPKCLRFENEETIDVPASW